MMTAATSSPAPPTCDAPAMPSGTELPLSLLHSSLGPPGPLQSSTPRSLPGDSALRGWDSRSCPSDPAAHADLETETPRKPNARQLPFRPAPDYRCAERMRR